ncbi:MAG: GspH/FimT family pseudopilin [Xanthomonadales bacterium]
MVTLSITASLLILGVPAFQDYSLRQRMSASISALHNDLLYGRSQAIYRDAQVVACPGSPNGGCTGSTDWTEGWIVFSDSNTDRQHQDSEDLLRHGQGLENIMIHSSAGRTNLRFYPNGSTPGSNVSISLCGLGGPEHARKLVISNLGRIRRDEAENLDPIHCP